MGTASVTPLEVATGYSAFANGGYKVNPFIIQRVVNEQNNVVYEAAPATTCPECDRLAKDDIDPFNKDTENKNPIDTLISTDKMKPAVRILSPQTAYLMTSVLQDAIQTGTGRAALALNRSDLAGKTGTTNNKMDAWYTGYNQSLVVSVWVGYDEPRTTEEYGSQAALPIWMKFMGPALEGVPQIKQPQPRGIVTVRIDPATGLSLDPAKAMLFLRYFIRDPVPRRMSRDYRYERSYISPYYRGRYDNRRERYDGRRERDDSRNDDSLF